jgi:CHAT domain-containing protein
MGIYFVAQGRHSAALKHFRASVEALEAARTLVPGEDLHTAFISNKLAIYEDIVALLIARGRPRDLAEALEYVERSKSRLLLERVQSALSEAVTPSENRAGTQGAAAETTLTELRARLNRMYSQIHPEDADGNARLMVSPRENAEQLEVVEGEYRAALRAAEIEGGPGLFSLLHVVSSSQLQSWLPSGEALVEYYVLHGTICAFVLSKSNPVKVVRNLAPVSEIEHTARRLRYHLKRAGSLHAYVECHKDQFLTGVQLPLARLFDILIRPLLPWIEGNHVTIVPHGVLHGLPFHSFYDSERQEYALDRWEISYSPSATVRYLDNMRTNGQRTANETTEALVMGVPDAGLEQIAVEVADLAHVLPEAKVYCGDSATLSIFREFAAGARLIHLATHALFRADNPLFSGLRFADGWLLARDLYTMRLNCDLVTLSACRTGQALVESGDEMFGLLRGFLAAGARAVAVSLWPAEDLPTATLMARFHALMAEGQSRTAALQLAQKYVRLTWQHPYQWAAFALFGER